MNWFARGLVPGVLVILAVTGCSDAKLDRKKAKEQLLKTLELQVSMESHFISRGQPVVVTLEFIGHPEFYPYFGAKNQRICFLPEVDNFRDPEGGVGIMLALLNDRGEQVYFKDEDVWQHGIKYPDQKPEENPVYRPFREGVMETVQLPLSEWYDLPPSGYLLRVYYRVMDPRSFWTGPTESNDLVFKITSW